MNQHCITCWIKFLNKKTKGIDDHYLMNLCPNCKKALQAPLFTMTQALADEKNSVHAVTCTLMPKYHHIPSDQVRDVYNNMVKHYLNNRRTPNYFEGYFEFTEQGVIHMHAYVVGRKNVVSQLYTAFRRIGFVLVKPIFDSETWITYILKEQDGDSPTPIKISS